jgi:hypothetical protein
LLGKGIFNGKTSAIEIEIYRISKRVAASAQKSNKKTAGCLFNNSAGGNKSYNSYF